MMEPDRDQVASQAKTVLPVVGLWFQLGCRRHGDKIAIRRPVPSLPLNRERTLADSMCMVGWLCRPATDGRRSPVRRLVGV